MTPIVFAIGDSVMQGAGPDLYATLPALVPSIEVDAIPNRQFHHAADVVRDRLRQLPAPDVIIVHLGTNGPLTDTHFDHLVDACRTARLLLVMNVQAPRDWVPQVNRRLRAGVQRHHPLTKLIDWSTATSSLPGALKNDGFHLSREGAVMYARTIATSLASESTWSTTLPLNRRMGRSVASTRTFPRDIRS